jgi:hypothetical protein
MAGWPHPHSRGQSAYRKHRSAPTMSQQTVVVLNGPTLNLLGER